MDFLGWSDMASIGYPSAKVSSFLSNGAWNLPSVSSALANEMWDSISSSFISRHEIFIQSDRKGTRPTDSWY